MVADVSRVANFIIGGTEKAGTTSVFMYLSTHPQVCAASSKETDFFRHESSGDRAADLANYSRYFSRCRARVPVVMEASPGYLGEAATVVPRIAGVLPDVKLLFILRDPAERLYSSYNFHVAKLNIPEEVDFEAYIDKCLAFEAGEADAVALGLDEWYLKVLGAGRYARFLEQYFGAFPREHIKLMFFEHLKDDPAAFMVNLSAFLEIDSTLWERFQFTRTNVTFSGSNKLLHRAAIYLNSKSEPFLRQRPKLKRALVGFYKKLNQAREGYNPMPPSAHRTLEAYYRPYNESLRDMLGTETTVAWLHPEPAVRSSG